MARSPLFQRFWHLLLLFLKCNLIYICFALRFTLYAVFFSKSSVFFAFWLSVFWLKKVFDYCVTEEHRSSSNLEVLWINKNITCLQWLQRNSGRSPWKHRTFVFLASTWGRWDCKSAFEGGGLVSCWQKGLPKMCLLPSKQFRCVF